MKYGYVSLEGWAALVCWFLTVLLIAVTISNLPSVSHETQRVSGASRAKTAGTHSPRDPGNAVAEPSAPPALLVAAALFGLTAIILTSRWIRNRL